MKFFLACLISFMVAGVVLRKQPPQFRSLVLAGMTLGVCVGYFFLRQI